MNMCINKRTFFKHSQYFLIAPRIFHKFVMIVTTNKIDSEATVVDKREPCRYIGLI